MYHFTKEMERAEGNITAVLNVKENGRLEHEINFM